MDNKLIIGIKTNEEISGDILAPLEGRPGKLWYAGLSISITAFLAGTFYTFRTLFWGIGEWGVDKTVGWGWAIVNFVWWIGIGHAGTFISAILLLFGQKWRNSINRAAEAMTIFAILCAAFFPIIHLGRVLLGFYIFPYLNTRNLWVNFNSPLLWDVFAITTYFLVSLVFWYIGLIPDLALIRDRSKGKRRRGFYRVLSSGWKGTGRQWRSWEVISLLLASLATPLVISVHSIVSMDFATSVIPGWHSTIFPPYFVAGAILSGFAMVSILLIVTRSALKLKDYITLFHIEAMNKIIIITGSIVGLAYLSEIFFAFYSGSEYEIYLLFDRFTGRYAIAFWFMMFCNLLVPQLFWIKKLRRNLSVTFIFTLLIIIGMWLERLVIVLSSLSRDYLPSSWTDYLPTSTDMGLFLGTLGFFFTMFFIFIRIFPVVSISEIKSIIHKT